MTNADIESVETPLTEKGDVDRPNRSDRPTDAYLVRFDDADTKNPKNWSKRKKTFTTFIVVAISFATGVTTGTFSGAAEGVQEEFGVAPISTTLITSLFLLGYAFGPLFMSPLSSRYGRKPIYLITWGLFTVFQVSRVIRLSFVVTS